MIGLRRAALGTGLCLPTIVAWLYFVALAAEGRGANPALQATYSTGKVLQFSLPVLVYLLFERSWPRPGRPTWRGCGLGAAFGLLVAAVTLLLYAVLIRYTHLFDGVAVQIRSKVEQFGLATPGGYIALASFLTIMHSLLEEYYWRWFILGELRRITSAPVAVAVSSLGFMAHHVVVLHVYFPDRFLTAVVPFSLCIAVGGAFWAWLYLRSGSIYGPWLSHLLVDAGIMTIGFLMLFGGMDVKWASLRP